MVKIKFSIPIYDGRSGPIKYWDHEFYTNKKLPKWISYDGSQDDDLECTDDKIPEYQLIREKLLTREIKKAPKGTLWRGFVEDVENTEDGEIWQLGS